MPRANGSTRHEILYSIKFHGPMTADELAREMGISQVAVRQHLASLEAEGLITVHIERRGLGRPSHRYHLTTQGDETFPRRYHQLATEMLSDLAVVHGPDALRSLLEHRRARVKAELLARTDGQPLSVRVRELARMFDEQGFMAEVREAPPDAFLLVKRNCAVCAIARNYPQVCCQGESEMIRDVLGQEVSVQYDRSIMDGDHACTLRIQPAPVPATREEGAVRNGHAYAGGE